MEGSYPRPGSRRHHGRHHAKPHQCNRPEGSARSCVRVTGHHIAEGAGGEPLTRHSNCEKSPCVPVLRNLTSPSSYSDSPSAMTCVDPWIWLKMFSNSTGLDLS